MEYRASQKKGVTLEYGVAQVRDLIAKTPDPVLSMMYKTICATTARAALDEGARKVWSEEYELMALMSDADVASEWKRWFEKAVAQLHGEQAVEFLRQVATGIMTVARGGN